MKTEYRNTDFVDMHFRVPQCYLCHRRTFFANFKSVVKISEGFKKWFKSLIVSIVGTETSVTKRLSRKYKFHVLKRKMLISLSHQKLSLVRSNAKSHSFFPSVVMITLMSFWVRDNSISLSEHRNLANTPFAVHYEKIRIHLREMATNSAKIHSLARKSEHLRINQIQ